LHWYVSIELPYNQGHRGPLFNVKLILYYMYITCYIGDIFHLLSCLINITYEYHVDLYSGHVEKKIFGFHVLVFKYLSDKSFITVLIFIVKNNVLWCIFALCSEIIKFYCFCPAVDKRRNRVLVIIPPCWWTEVSSPFLYMDRVLSAPQS
jgi:hypothetical protein